MYDSMRLLDEKEYELNMYVRIKRIRFIQMIFGTLTMKFHNE